MKEKTLWLWNKAILSRPFIIEKLNEQLKNISQIKHSRRRSPNGFRLNILVGLLAYYLKENKPCLNISDIERGAIVTA